MAKTTIMGKYTWIYFIGWLENIKEEYFVQAERAKSDYKLLNTIMFEYYLAHLVNSHAKGVFEIYDLCSVKYKQKHGLIKYLFTFHNAVNTRGRKKVFDEGILQQYKKSI